MNAESYVERVQDLPSPSESVMRLMDLLAVLESDHAEIVAVVRRDAPLCVQVLAVCNSAYLGLPESVGSLEQAVLHLGYEELYRVILGISLGGSFCRELTGYGLKPNDLWRHSLLTALSAQWIWEKAERAPDVDTSIVYTAGLVHDIGKLVLGQLVESELQERIRKVVEEGNMPLVWAERSVNGVDHAQVGACLLEKWGFPSVVVEAVKRHHEPVCQSDPTLSAVLSVANCVAHAAVGGGWSKLGAGPETTALEALALTEEAVEQTLEQLQESMGDIERWVVASA